MTPTRRLDAARFLLRGSVYYYDDSDDSTRDNEQVDESDTTTLVLVSTIFFLFIVGIILCTLLDMFNKPNEASDGRTVASVDDEDDLSDIDIEEASGVDVSASKHVAIRRSRSRLSTVVEEEEEG
jgi:hypothetical protein